MLSLLMASRVVSGSSGNTGRPIPAIFMQEPPTQAPTNPVFGQAGKSIPGMDGYATRERLAGDLEEFKGGGPVGLIALIIVVIAVTVLVAIISPW